MTAQPQSPLTREVEAAARRYRRDGYAVSRPDRLRDKPSFLGDLVPDLIAKRDDDNVVIEVKYAAKVRGSNDIVELAERVARQPGWRFELIALRSIDDQLKPDLSWGDETVARLVAQDFRMPAFIVVCSMIENILGFAAQHEKMRAANMSPADILKALVVKGVIDDEMRETVRGAYAKRNALMHDPKGSVPGTADIRSLLSLAQKLERDVLAARGSAQAAE